jgi:hypothetical protein
MILLLLALAQASPATAPARPGDYPTETRADYVMGCMAANGETREMLQRCSCSIDVIASALPFEDYERAETVLEMRGVTGQRASLLNEVPLLRHAVQRLREAQVEADFRCF